MQVFDISKAFSAKIAPTGISVIGRPLMKLMSSSLTRGKYRLETIGM